jgi:DNA-binding response OmpR family regulator
MNGRIEGRKRVLIIEDEPDFAAILKYRLQQKGHEAVVAVDGENGLEQASRCHPDLIVLDLMLPKMAGLEVCRYIRSNPAMGHVPIWIMTALDPISNKAKGFMMGADDFFSKSCHLPELLSRIDALFDQRNTGAVPPACATTDFVRALTEEMLTDPACQPQLKPHRIAPLSES